jgi:hypothetical protein
MKMTSLMNNGMMNNMMNNRYLKIAGIVIGAAALLYYPALKAYQMIQKRRMARQEGNEEERPVKNFAPSYRGNHKPHHRKAEANGHLGHASA